MRTIKQQQEETIQYLESRGIDWDWCPTSSGAEIVAYVRNYHQGKDLHIRLTHRVLAGGMVSYPYMRESQLDKVFKELEVADLSSIIELSKRYEEIYVGGDELLRSYNDRQCC